MTRCIDVVHLLQDLAAADPGLLRLLLEFVPSSVPLSWSHVPLMRNPHFAVPILAGSSSGAHEAWLSPILHASSVKLHLREALRVPSPANPDIVDLVGPRTPPPPPVLRPADPSEDTPRYCYNFRKVLNLGGRAAISAGNEAALHTLLQHGLNVARRNPELLWRAAKAGNVAIVKLLASLNASPEHLGAVTLNVACNADHADIVQVLLDFGIGHSPAEWGEALHGAAESNAARAVSVMLAHGVRIASGQQPGELTWAEVTWQAHRALQVAAATGCAAVTPALISFPKHAQCDRVQGIDHWPPTATLPHCRQCAASARACIPSAAGVGSDAVVGQLLDAGVVGEENPQAVVEAWTDGYIAGGIVRAAEFGFAVVLREFLSRGAAEHQADTLAEAACAAARQGQIAVLWELMAHYGINPSDRDPTVIADAARKGHTAACVLLLQHGADPCVQDGAALLGAATYAHTDTLQLLMGALDASPSAGVAACSAEQRVARWLKPHSPMPMRPMTPQDQAVADSEVADPALVQALLNTADLPVVPADIRKSAALREACKRGHSQVVDILVAHGADPAAVANQSLFNAMHGGHVSIAEALLATGRVHVGRDEMLMAHRSPAAPAMLALLEAHGGKL